MYDEVMMKLPGGDSVPVNVSASGPTTLVVGVAGKSILVVYGVLIGTAATSITIEDTDGRSMSVPCRSPPTAEWCFRTPKSESPRNWRRERDWFWDRAWLRRLAG